MKRKYFESNYIAGLQNHQRFIPETGVEHPSCLFVVSAIAPPKGMGLSCHATPHMTCGQVWHVCLFFFQSWTSPLKGNLRFSQVFWNFHHAFEEGIFCHRLVLIDRSEPLKRHYFIVGSITSSIFNNVKLKNKNIWDLSLIPNSQIVAFITRNLQKVMDLLKDKLVNLFLMQRFLVKAISFLPFKSHNSFLNLHWHLYGIIVAQSWQTLGPLSGPPAARTTKRHIPIALRVIRCWKVVLKLVSMFDRVWIGKVWEHCELFLLGYSGSSVRSEQHHQTQQPA